MPIATVTKAPLTITLFGPMQVQVKDRPLPPLRSRKALWLLALLTLRHDRPVEREWLAGTLWPDTDPNRASTNLRVNLSELRRALGDQSERIQSPARNTLSLDLIGAEADVVTFDDALANQTPEGLRQAVALYRGPLLEDCAEEWVGQERNVRKQNCLLALQTLADTAMVAGDYATAIDYYRRAVELDPWRETARRGWMEALAKSGDRNAAMLVYREFIELLHRDSSAVPDEETSALYARLRAETRPRASHQDSKTTAKTVVNAAVPATVRGYLPHPLTDLIGREEECLEVAAKLRGSRLVTLTGPGGIGKTRLAIEVARESAEDGSAFPDGVWLVALESLSDGRLVAAQVASVLGVRETRLSLLENLIDHLRAKRLLLIVDNCEHLLETSIQVAGRLLRECAHLRILATSREALGIMGETIWQVPPMAAPDPAYLPQKLEGDATLLRVLADYESVQLFIERAEACQKGFALSGSNALAVAQACSQLEGIPLAIELAAARVKAMTVEQIAVRLSDRLGLLSAGNRRAQSRQQTLRATLDWSYALLSEAERVLLHRLSVFARGWTLEAAEQVGSGERIESGEVLECLTSLVDKSLVVFEEREEEGGGRYRLLEIIRQYAAEGLETSGEIQRIKTRHRDWFVSFVETAKLMEADPQRSLNRLEAETDNLRAALIWCREDAQGAEAGLRLASALGRFWYLRSHYSEGRKHLEQALERPEVQAATALRAKALNGAGILASTQGDYAAAQTLLEESLRIYQTLEDWSNSAIVMGNLGVAYYHLGKYASARSLYEESLKLHRLSGDRLGVARILNSLGNLARNQGEYAEAQALLTESLSIRKELGDRRGIAVASNNLGDVALNQGEYSLARALYEEGLAINREAGDRQGMAISLGYLGVVARSEGEFASAQALHEESLHLFTELGDQSGLALTLNNLGELAYDQGKFTTARSLYKESLNIHRVLGDWPNVMASLQGLAMVLLAQEERQHAVRLWGAAHQMRDTLGIPLPLASRAKYDQQVDQARAVLGEEAFTVAWEEGRVLSWIQAVEDALSD